MTADALVHLRKHNTPLAPLNQNRLVDPNCFFCRSALRNAGLNLKTLDNLRSAVQKGGENSADR